MSLMKNVETLNSLFRSLLALLVVGAVGYAGWFGYSAYEAKRNLGSDLEQAKTELAQRDQQLASQQQKIQQQDQVIGDLNRTIEQKNERIQQLDTAMRLLKVDHRLAHITVLDQGQNDSGETYTVVEFQEVNDQGAPIDDARQFRLNGDTVYVDCWIVQFEDAYVERADVLRSTSLCLFKSIYGNNDKPSAAQPLEEIGMTPKVYARGGVPSQFEQQIWSDFWNIANDREKAEQLGIRAINGQANFTQVREGKVYRLQLRASGGLSTLPAEDAKPRPTPSAS